MPSEFLKVLPKPRELNPSRQSQATPHAVFLAWHGPLNGPGRWELSGGRWLLHAKQTFRSLATGDGFLPINLSSEVHFGGSNRLSLHSLFGTKPPKDIPNQTITFYRYIDDLYIRLPGLPGLAQAFPRSWPSFPFASDWTDGPRSRATRQMRYERAAQQMLSKVRRGLSRSLGVP